MLKLFVIGLLIVSLMGCSTCREPPIFPEDLPAPVLTGDDNRDIVGLMVREVRWRLLTAQMRWIAGVYTDEQYDEKSEKLLDILREIQNAG